MVCPIAPNYDSSYPKFTLFQKAYNLGKERSAMEERERPVKDTSGYAVKMDKHCKHITSKTLKYMSQLPRGTSCGFSFLM
jgi:hypothetical protein